MAREMGRVDNGDGTHTVRVAVDYTTISNIVFLDDAVDGPGFQDAMDAHQRYHENLIRIREGLAAL